MPIKGVGWSEHCCSCVGYGWGEKLAVPEGSGSTGVMLWGEALGSEEERDQLPFRPHAQAGSLLERAIRMAGFTRSQFTLTNSVMCRPPANKLDGQPYERAAVESCHHYNDRLVAGRQPHVILALGAVPTRALTDFDGSTRQRSISMVRGWVAPSRAYTDQAEVLVPGYANHDPLPVLPTLHPSYIQRGAKEFLAVLVHDIRLTVHMARQGIGSPAPVQYQLAPSVSDALSFLELVRSNRQALLSYDIETPWSKDHDEDDNPESTDAPILSIQFSLGAYRGIAFPWAGRYIEIARDILAEANPKLGANSWQYDEPRLAVHDVQVRGVHHDLRWAFHCLYPDLPSNLQFVCSFLSTRMRLLTQNSYDRDAAAERAWKHTAQVEGSDYGCRDVDMPHRAWPLLVDELHRVGAWRSYAEHTLRVRPILVRASEYGIPVSRPMHHAFETRLQTELSAKMAELQGIVPDDLKGVQPPGGYKNPKLAEKRMALPNQGLAEGERWIEMEFTNDSRRGKDRGRDSVGSSEVGAGSLYGDGDSAIGSDCVEDAGDGQARHETGARTVTRWARLQPFLPDSPQQVVKLIRSLGDRVPKQDDGEGDTTGKAGLERLARQTKRPVYRLILECRALAEMRGTHVEGWRPNVQVIEEATEDGGEGRADASATGRVHPSFTFTPSTGQLACSSEETTQRDGINHDGLPEIQTDSAPSRLSSVETSRGRKNAQGSSGFGRVHPSFTFTPATGQLACYGSPNALNPPKPKGQAEKDRLAVSFRQMIEARPGYRLWELDLKSAHALTLGFEADCPEYMRLARLDIHSYVAAHLERVPDVRDCLAWPDDQLALFLADVKRRYKATRDDRAKPSILGLGFGMGYRKLYAMNRESFTGEADARRVRDMLRSLFPRVFEWQDEVRALAHRRGFLLSRHGAIRWFQDVYHHDWRRGQVVAGEDSEAAIAFLPANDAFGYLKDAMLMLDDQCGGPCEGACNTLFGGQSPCNTDGWLAECGLMIPFHDALVFEMPRSLEDDAIPRIYQAMTAPSPVLDGLSIGASVSCGSDWASMEELNEEEFLGK